MNEDIASVRRFLVILDVPGFSARWLDTPERIQKLLEFAGQCIVEARELPPNAKLTDAAQ